MRLRRVKATSIVSLTGNKNGMFYSKKIEHTIFRYNSFLENVLTTQRVSLKDLSLPGEQARRDFNYLVESTTSVSMG